MRVIGYKDDNHHLGRENLLDRWKLGSCKLVSPKSGMRRPLLKFFSFSNTVIIELFDNKKDFVVISTRSTDLNFHLHVF